MRTQQGQAVLFWICLTGILNKGKGKKKKEKTHPYFHSTSNQSLSQRPCTEPVRWHTMSA